MGDSVHLPTVGFVGLGIMGLPMARNLLNAGHPLAVHTRTQDRAAELVASGAQWCSSPRELALASDLVITMLPDSADVLAVVDGQDGVLAGAHGGLTWIDASSIDPGVTRELVERARRVGVDCLDAPVSGGERGAIDGTLSVMVGGSREVFDRCAPILERLGGSVTYIGEAGSGQIAKLCNQVVVGCTIAAIAEAFLLAIRSGADSAVVRQVMLGGFAQSRVLEVHGERMLERRFDPGFRTALHLKDLRNAFRTAQMIETPLPMTAAVIDLMEIQLATGGGDLDHSALLTAYESLVVAQGD